MLKIDFSIAFWNAMVIKYQIERAKAFLKARMMFRSPVSARAKSGKSRRFFSGELLSAFCIFHPF